MKPSDIHNAHLEMIKSTKIRNDKLAANLGRLGVRIYLDDKLAPNDLIVHVGSKLWASVIGEN